MMPNSISGVPYQVVIEITKTPSEICSGKVVRYGWFSVGCNQCKDLLLSGKWLDDDFEDLVWRAIRAHFHEHVARTLYHNEESMA